MNTLKTSNKIESVKIEDSTRLIFLPEHLPKAYLLFEKHCFRSMEIICNSYNGGYWDFFNLSNGGFYIAPTEIESYQICVIDNYFDGILSAKATGIVTTLFALNALSWETKSSHVIDKYELLIAFAKQHKECKLIFSAID
mgnify:CR=1 FL=1